MLVKMESSAVGGGNITQGKWIRPSSVNVSSTYDSSYVANNAVVMNFTTYGWLPSSNASSGWIEIDFGSAKDVDYVLFGLTSNTYSSVINTTDIDIEIYSTTSETYGTADYTGKFVRQGTGFVYCIYPINKSAQKVKVSISGTLLTAANGFKIMAFEKI